MNPPHKTVIHHLPASFARWFEDKKWIPHQHQLDIVESLQNGQSALLIAPTGAGKLYQGSCLV